jgi:hypothetical protein
LVVAAPIAVAMELPVVARVPIPPLAVVLLETPASVAIVGNGRIRIDANSRFGLQGALSLCHGRSGDFSANARLSANVGGGLRRRGSDVGSAGISLRADVGGRA